jgi:glycosyltransferase involved in cell wall biosynthesis
MNSRARILITAISYHPDFPTGASRLAYDEAEFLAARGHEVWLVAPDMIGGQSEYMESGSLRVLRYPLPRHGRFDPRMYAAHQQRTRAVLVRHIPRDGIDALHGHAVLQLAGALSLYGATARTAFTVHSPVRLEKQMSALAASPLVRLNLYMAGVLAHRIERRVIERVDAVCANSEYTRELIRRAHGPAQAGRTLVVPGWVDPKKYQILPDRTSTKKALGWPTDVPVLFTLRRLVPRMGVETLLNALAIVKMTRQPFRMVIGGAGPLLASLESLASGLGLGDAVTFAGRLPETRLPEYYGACDAFVLPTARLECFGLILLEALACGRPTLATPVGAIPEIVRRFEPGWLASGPAPKEIADLIVRYLRGELPSIDPQTLRRGVEERYSAPRVIGELVSKALGLE